MPILLYLALSLVPPHQTAAVPPAPAVTAVPAEDPVVTALARKIYAQMRAGKVDTALLAPPMAAALTPGALAQSRPMFDQLGDPTTLKLEAINRSSGGTSYLYLATFPSAQFHVSISIDPEGKVADYLLKP